MASVRSVKVGNTSYLQVVEYIHRQDGKIVIDVIKSFGRDSLENRLRAEQFAAEYDRLKHLAHRYASTSTRPPAADFLQAAIAIFGFILGAAIVVEILKQIFGEEG